MSFCGFVDFYFFFRNDMVCLKGKLSKMLYIKMLKRVLFLLYKGFVLKWFLLVKYV